MAQVTENLTHVSEALNRLLEQYKNKPNIVGFLESIVTGMQTSEAMFIDLRDNRTLDNAEGTNLDNIGSIVGVVRLGGESDTDYRLRIKQRILANRAQGTVEAQVDCIQFLTASTIIIYFEGAEASFAFNINDTGLTAQEIETLMDALNDSKPAGVTIEHVTAFNGASAFSFDGDAIGLGFGDSTNASIGGEFATAL